MKYKAPTSAAKMLVEGFMNPKGISRDKLASLLCWSTDYLDGIITRQKTLSVQDAQDISSIFGPSPEYWMSLEANFKLWINRSKKEDT